MGSHLFNHQLLEKCMNNFIEVSQKFEQNLERFDRGQLAIKLEEAKQLTANELKLRGFSIAKQRAYEAILRDCLDTLTTKTGGVGLVRFDEADAKEYSRILGCTISLDDFEAYRQWSKFHSDKFGLGCKTTKEYQEFIFNNDIPANAQDYTMLSRIKQIKDEASQNKFVVPNKKYWPQGPVDTRFFTSLED